MPKYLDWIETELRPMLEKCDDDAVVSWVKQRIVESFKNGQSMPARTPKKSEATKADVK